MAIVFSDEGLPFTVEFVHSLRTNLISESPFPVELKVEFSDRMNYPDDIYLQKFTDLIHLKYSQPPPDVVLGLGEEAASIVARHGEKLFGNIPMVLLTARPRYNKDSTVRPHLKNLVYDIDILSEVILIERLLPETRHLFIVSGSSQSDREGAKLARESLKDYQGPLEVVHLSDLNKEELLTKVARLPENAVLLYLSFTRDAKGAAFVSRDVLSQISESANAPVFGVFDTYLGHGIVGGHLLSAGDEGKKVAETTLQILRNEAPAAVNRAPTKIAEFDWRQLRRWGIEERRLPPGSVLQFKTPSFWDKYRKYIVFTVLVIFLQGVLIFFLLTENARRRRAEGHLTKRLAFEEMLSQVSARFVDLPSDQVSSQIAVELRTVGEYFKVDRITVFELSETDQRLVLLQSYVDSNVPPPSAQIEFGRCTWACEKILRREIFHFSDTEELPQEAAVEKDLLQSQGIQSAVVLPLTIGERTRGVLVFGMVTRRRKWSQDMIKRYGMVAQFIEHAFTRKQSNEALLQSQRFTRSILDSLPHQIAVLDRQGTILDVNTRWEGFARENSETSREPSGPGANYLEVCRRSSESGDALAEAALEGIRSVLEGARQEFLLDYPCDSPKGKHWFLMRAIPFSGCQGSAVVAHIDTTQQKMAEIDLRNAYAEIEHLKNQLEAESSYLQEEIRLEHNYSGIIGQSAAIQYVLYKVEQVAATDTTVLVLGETGTGKELICRAIHSQSPRKRRPLVKVNCAALPANLIESELFGHERGAFSGATDRRVGRFEVADRGTLFLDEIGELPLELQGKLLRVLEDGEFERLGSSVTTKVDVRVIAATNRDLEKRIQDGGFREDLYYRLGVFPITVPPLRGRREDIPLLTRHFVEQAAKRLGKNIQFISENMMEQLQDYSWPGNVRELKNVVDRAVIHCAKPKLHLAEKLFLPASKNDSELKGLQDIEIDHIVRVLETTKWRIDGHRGAAAILKLNPSTLRSRMRKLGIQRQ